MTPTVLPTSGLICLDLDGVLWRGNDPIPGSAAAVETIRQSGYRVAYLTNNANAEVDEVVAKLAGIGVVATASDVVTSAQAAAAAIAREFPPASRVLACGGPGLVAALETAGLVVAESAPVVAVAVGWHRTFDFDGLDRAAAAIRNGARFVATNTDATYPAAERLLPGAGALVAAVAVASGTQPLVAGKPEVPMATLVAERLGAAALMVGDRISTDGAFARRLGCPFSLVLSGVTTSTGAPGTETVPDPAPPLTFPSLVEVAGALVGAG